MLLLNFFFQAEDGIRDLVRSRGLGDVYKRQCLCLALPGRLVDVLVARSWPLLLRSRLSRGSERLSLIHI